jgi:hypothetical protein
MYYKLIEAVEGRWRRVNAPQIRALVAGPAPPVALDRGLERR